MFFLNNFKVFAFYEESAVIYSEAWERCMWAMNGLRKTSMHTVVKAQQSLYGVQ